MVRVSSSAYRSSVMTNAKSTAVATTPSSAATEGYGPIGTATSPIGVSSRSTAMRSSIQSSASDLSTSAQASEYRYAVTAAASPAAVVTSLGTTFHRKG